jgi:hypothetical protein
MEIIKPKRTKIEIDVEEGVRELKDINEMLTQINKNLMNIYYIHQVHLTALMDAYEFSNEKDQEEVVKKTLH